MRTHMRCPIYSGQGREGERERDLKLGNWLIRQPDLQLGYNSKGKATISFLSSLSLENTQLVIADNDHVFTT